MAISLCALTTADAPDLADTDGDGAPQEVEAIAGEFERTYKATLAGGDERDAKTLALATNALLEFRPHARPVLWRMLIAQARLYQALLRTTSEPVPATEAEWKKLLSLEGRDDFEWQDGDGPPITETIKTTDDYLKRTVVETFRRSPTHRAAA